MMNQVCPRHIDMKFMGSMDQIHPKYPDPQTIISQCIILMRLD